eukprot:CAMPEP_0114496950 /NCGR_PEP_ID=MMETSP0109-20121206/6048_1 /TAXON_ID=29199 /ORGANISM="Chlorarachnion reptans, Strain CCCM449" /LENGTH=476 /DNA_ID=CAMNT_0001674267 /DNA_START=51 /DNA_END=1481 /DNA_ORIENTATION=+
MSTVSSNSGASRPGILGWSVYVPSMYVSQEELEAFDGVSAGKYTKGLGQENMAFVDPAEDIISMMLSATQQLIERTGINPLDVGRLEVGTETLVDKSKSTKTSLMRLFGENSDIEGVDTINACYGGTNALFNCLNWMSSSAWDGRYAIVVTGDIAVYEPGPARCTGGAGVVAMLVGPDAPVEIDITAPRATHMEDVYDFYKPDLNSEYPKVDGHLSNACYLRALDRCFATLARKTEARTKTAFNINDFDHFLFHQPYAKLVQKSHARLLFNQHKLSKNVDPRLDDFVALAEEETYGNRDLDKLIAGIGAQDYKEKVFPGTYLCRQVGNMYTGSLYAALVSLVSEYREKLDGQNALMFSYGSGLAATMFQAKFNQQSQVTLDTLADQADLKNLISERVIAKPEEYSETLELREKTYGQFPISVEKPRNVRQGAFFLAGVDNLGRREYNRAFSTSTMRSRRAFGMRRPLSTMIRLLRK